MGGIGQSGDAKASAGLVATDDEDKARATLEKSAEGKLTKHDYKGVEYLTDDSGEAGAVFDGFLVLGTEAGVKAAIDTSKGGTEALGRRRTTRRPRQRRERPARLLLRQLARSCWTRRARRRTPLPDSFGKFFKEPVVGDHRRGRRRRGGRGRRPGRARSVVRRSSARAATCSATCPPTRGSRSARRISGS